MFQVKWDPKCFGFAFEPRVIDFGQISPNSRQKQLVRICGDIAQSFTGTIDSIATDENKGSVQATLDVENNAIMVTLKAGSLPGTSRGALLAFSSNGKRLGACPISWEVVPEVRALPDALYLGTAAPGDRRLGLVALRHASGLSPHVTEVRLLSGTPDSSAHLSEESPDQAAVQVEFVAPNDEGVVRSTLRVTCQIFGDNHELDIPVFLVVRRQQ